MAELVCRACYRPLEGRDLCCSKCSNLELKSQIEQLQWEKRKLEEELHAYHAERRVVFYVRASGVTQGFNKFEHAKAYAIREFQNQYEPLNPCDVSFLKKLQYLSEEAMANSAFFVEYDNCLFTLEKSFLHRGVPKQQNALGVWESVSSQLMQI